MGYLLKEALKSLCGVNQWSYAVFWKIGCQNPKLLIWEEFYYEPLQISSLPNNFENGNHESASTELRDHWISPQVHASQNGAQVVGERVHLLIDKMMMANQVNVVGEGLVGRAAFTGNYQWIVLGSYNENAQPTEVITEIRLQFLAGMQTIAVIPIFPHGVVQLGSSLAIMENGGFVHDVKSLILQLSCVPSALVSDNYPQKDSAQIFATPLTNLTSESAMDPYVNFMSMNSHSTSESFIPQRNLSFSSKPSPSAFTRSRDNLKTMSSRFQIPEVSRDSFQSNPDYCVQEARHVEKTKHSEISSTLNDYGAVTSVRSEYTNRAQATAWDSRIVGAPKDDYMTSPHANMSSAQVTGFRFHHADSTHNLLPRGISHEHYTADMHYGNHFPTSENPISGNLPVESSDGNDLFDVLGADFKNKLLSRDDKQVCNEAGSVMKNQFKHMGVQDPNSDFYPNYQTNSESGVFSVCGSDNLLDAMVSGVNSTLRQMSEDSMSCRTTLSKISGSPVLNSSRICCQTQDQFTGLSKRLGAAVGTSSGPPCGRNDAGSGSQTSSIYGSQISSWVEQGTSLQYDTSISTANSKKPNEAGKSNRKRLKPGENPRPRPKDRQMIQDRVKELREIVPNGAKCSIDSLLERTIKHMLFLQSVTKHADKLKQAVEPKITGKEGGFLLKDNFEGGATWAFEVGSQSMVCPIVVEDLNPPRQLLVEMLCEERGSFLEIADIIRGLGLTILKGVMEARNDKVWARFAVEANRDVTRMEIFISLVQLLNQTEKSSTGPVHPIQQQPVGTVLCPEPSSI